jgi:hypothetical protein
MLPAMPCTAHLDAPYAEQRAKVRSPATEDTKSSCPWPCALKTGTSSRAHSHDPFTFTCERARRQAVTRRRARGAVAPPRAADLEGGVEVCLGDLLDCAEAADPRARDEHVARAALAKELGRLAGKACDVCGAAHVADPCCAAPAHFCYLCCHVLCGLLVAPCTRERHAAVSLEGAATRIRGQAVGFALGLFL